MTVAFPRAFITAILFCGLASARPLDVPSNHTLVMAQLSVKRQSTPARKADTLTPDEQKRLAATINRLTPKQRKQLAKAMKQMTPDQQNQVAAAVRHQMARTR